MQRSDQGDELVPKKPSESEFEKSYAPGAKPGTPLKLGSVDYGADLHDSPLMRTVKRALTGWHPPSDPPVRGPALKDDDPRLQPTVRAPGREAWRKAVEELVVSAGAVQAQPTLFGFAGPAGAFVARLWAERALGPEMVRVEPEWLSRLVPEHSVLTSLGEGRAAQVVREEAAGIADGAFAAAVAQKRDVLCAPLSVPQLQQAKPAGFRRLVLALVDKGVARDFEALVKESDELLLLLAGPKLEVVAQAKGGQLYVRQDRLFKQFTAMKEP